MKKILQQLICAIFLSATASLNAAVTSGNVALDGTAYANQPLFGNAQARMLNDGDIRPSFHGDTGLQPGFAYTLDLGKDRSVTALKIYPRQDNCCADRLSNFRVSLHSDAGGSIGAEVWGTNLFTDGTNPGVGAGKVVNVVAPTPTTARWVQILSLDATVPNYALQVTELEVIADLPPLEVNRALGAIITANQPTYAGTTAAALVDGNRVNYVHGAAGLQPGYAYDINLGVEVDIDHIDIFAREGSCCETRLSNYRVEVHNDNNGQIGDLVWSADLHTDESNAGSGIGAKDVVTKDMGTAGAPFKGQWLRIVALGDTVPDYALQIAEVEVFGAVPDVVNLLLTAEPADIAGGVSGTATFSVTANAANGDPALVSYQWQKNGANIPGGTQRTYTTPTLLAGDHGSKYRVLVSYPGVQTLTSREATLRISYAYGAAVTTSGPLWLGLFQPGEIVDGNRASFIHGEANPPTGFKYELKLGSVVRFDSIDIYPRQDACCPERLGNFRFSIHNDNNGQIGEEVWGVDMFPNGNAGSGPGVVAHIVASMDADGKFEGRWFRIQALDDPVPAYFLQIAEVEAFGTLIDNTPRLSISQQSTTALAALGRSAKLSVSASVFNGNPSQISYQWRRNGVPIAGATTNTYTTPALQQSDATAKYTLAISYPGIPDLVSAEIPVVFDNNYARNAAITSNRKLWVGIPDWTLGLIVDGDPNTYVHGDTAIVPGMAYEINMGDEVSLEKIDIFPRQDGCCPERLANFRVSIHKDNGGTIGDAVWTTDLFTEFGANAGSGPGMVVTLTPDMDPAGVFKGQWIRILALDDPLGDYALQIGDVAALGAIAARPLLSFNSTGGLTLTWSDGTLQSATDVAGPWSNVNNASSPYSPPRTADKQFFRLQKPLP